MPITHIPVLLEEVIENLKPGPGKIFLDCTIGDGGHAEELLRLSSPDGLLIGIDQDEEALRSASERLKNYGKRVRIVHDNFKNIKNVLEDMEVDGVDGIILDLGVSTSQLMDPGRGFSFRTDGPLDMRMNRREGVTAESLVNNLAEDELVKIIREYGEERYASKIAKAIVRERKKERIASTLQLAKIIRFALPGWRTPKRIDPATRTFQALRIAVNNELKILKKALMDASTILRPAGRICVITFHSLEDRIVKNTFRELSHAHANAEGNGETNVEGKEYGAYALKIITGRPIRPTLNEQQSNPRSRSAKLRVAERYR